MTFIGRAQRRVAIFAFVFGTVSASAGADPMYILTDLGTLGGNASFALDVNNLGDVSGNSRTSTTTLPLIGYVWSQGTMTSLGVLPGSNDFSRGYALNDHGVVVGESDNNASRAFRWEAGTLTDLGTLGGATAVAYDINNAGQIVGSASNGQASRPFLYENGQMYDMGTPDGTTTTAGRVSAINQHGDMAGLARNAANTTTQAALWTGGVGGTVTSLGSLGDGQQFSAAAGIADNGWVVGYSNVIGRTKHAFLWSALTGMIDLGTLGYAHSRATDVNASGQIVGFASTFAGNASFGGAAFLWQNGTLFDLNQLLVGSVLGWNLLSAEGINELGQIVGYGLFNGEQRAYLLTPVPEPATLGLLSAGLAMAARFARRRRLDRA